MIPHCQADQGWENQKHVEHEQEFPDALCY